MRNWIFAAAVVLVWAGLAAGAEPATMPTAAGQTWTNSIGMRLGYIPAGEFYMGTAADDRQFQQGETRHRVVLSKPFLMGVYPVTQGQWKAVTGNSPSWFGWIGDENVPVDNVSWNDAVGFCRALSRKEGLHYHLPTEAQWEYACRAGTTTAYYAGDGEEALAEAGWYAGNSAVRTHAVGGKAPNAWGLYDMHGDVWQWCADWYADYSGREARDPTGPEQGWSRVLRGGAWYSEAPYCRSACRGAQESDHRGFGIGARVCVDLP